MNKSPSKDMASPSEPIDAKLALHPASRDVCPSVPLEIRS